MAIDNAKILNVRIKNKYDSYENWINSGLILEAGEIAIAHTTIDVAVENGTVKHPGLLMKVGDGEKTFSALPWLSAKAADVLSVCKNETDLKEFIKTVISADDGALKQLETALKALITKEETRALAAEAKLAQDILAVDGKVNELARIEAEGKAALTKALNEETTARKEDKQELVKALEETRNTVANNKAELAQDIADAEAAAKQHADDLNTAMDTRMDAVEGLLGLGEEATGKTVAEQIAEAVKEVQDEVDALEQTHATDKAELAKAIEDEVQAREEAVQGVQDAVDELATTHTTDKEALEKAIEDAVKAGEEADGNLQDAIDALAETHATDKAALEAVDKKLTDDLAAEVKRATEAEAALAKAIEDEAAKAREEEGKLANAINLLIDSTDGDETKLNSIKELATWIEEHGSDAAEMAEAIEANATAISNEIARAEAAEKAIAEFDEDGKLIGGALFDEVTRAEAAEKDLTDDLAQEVEDRKADVDAEEARAKAAEEVIAKFDEAGDLVDGALFDEVTRAKEAEEALAEKVTALEEANKEGGAVAEAIADAKQAALDAVDELKNNEVKANADAIAQEVEDRKAAITQEVTDRNQAIADAIAQEVTDRNTAIEKAIETEVTNRNTAIEEAVEAEAEARDTAIATAKQEAIDAAAEDATEKADTAEANAKAHTDALRDELADIAFTGSTDDLVQGLMTLVFDCGTSANVSTNV